MTAPPRPVYILGAGGLAKEMAQLAHHVGIAAGRSPDVAGFIGSKTDGVGRDLGFGKIVGDDEWLLGSGIQADIVIGIGHPQARAAVALRFLAQPDQFGFPNLIHPTAVLDHDRVSLGQGNCVTAGCTFTCDIEVAGFNLFNLHVTVGHDVRVGSFNVVNPGVNISGGVQLGDRILVGTGAQLLENRHVGEGATIGAGAVVTRDVAPGVTVTGVPARPFAR